MSAQRNPVRKVPGKMSANDPKSDIVVRSEVGSRPARRDVLSAPTGGPRTDVWDANHRRQANLSGDIGRRWSGLRPKYALRLRP